MAGNNRQHLRTLHIFAAIVASCAGSCAIAFAEDERAAIAAWAARAEAFRRTIEDEGDGAFIDAALACMYAQGGSSTRSLAAARRAIASKSQASASDLGMMIQQITMHLGDDSAEELLTAIEEGPRREMALNYVLMEQGSKGRLAAARRCAAHVRSTKARNEAWIWFAVGANGARRFESARAATREIDPQNDDQRARLERTREVIEKRASEPPKASPPSEVLWANAEESDNASHWTAAAAAYLKGGDRTKSRAALSRAEVSAEGIELYSIKAANLTQIAQLFLEMDDLPEAGRVAKKAAKVIKDAASAAEAAGEDAAGKAGDFIEEFFSGYAVSPALVYILARCGALDSAIEFAEVNPQWISLGAGCTSDELQTALRKRLPVFESDRQRALACIGVVQGLVQRHRERQRRR